MNFLICKLISAYRALIARKECFVFVDGGATLFNSSMGSQKYLLQTIKEEIDKRGFAVVCAGGNEPFCYSVGFANAGLPDVFITGPVDVKSMVQVISDVFARWKKQSYCYDILSRAINDDDADILPIEMNADSFKSFVHVNISFYKEFKEYGRRENGVEPFAQILCTDPAGNFPYEEDYDRKNLKQQMFIDRASPAYIGKFY